MVRINQHATVQAIPSMHSPGNAQKAQIWPVSLNQSDTERRKISIPWPKSNHQFWKWSGCISMQNFRLFPQCILREMTGNHKIWPVSLSKKVSKLNKSTDWDYNLINSEGGQDTSACKISGHSLHALSGKCLETTYLNRFTKSKWCQEMENQQIMTKI